VLRWLRRGRRHRSTRTGKARKHSAERADGIAEKLDHAEQPRDEKDQAEKEAHRLTPESVARWRDTSRGTRTSSTSAPQHTSVEQVPTAK